MRFSALVCACVCVCTSAEILFQRDHIQKLTKRFRDNSVLEAMVPMRLDSKSKVIVTWDFSVQKLLHFDVGGLMKLSGWYRLRWNDQALLFNGTEEFGPDWSHTSRLNMKPEDIWTPDVYPYYTNDAEEEAAIRSTRATIYDETFLKAEGYNVYWSRLAVITFHCSDEGSLQGSIENFPFDEHTCTAVVGPWDSDRKSYDFHAWGTKMRQDAVIRSPEWQIREATYQNFNNVYESGEFQEVHLRLTLRRYPHFFLTSTVYPMLLQVCVGSFSQWIPLVDGGASTRIGLLATILLTLMATSLVTAPHRPMSDALMWIDKFQACCLLLTFLPLIWAAIMAWTQHRFIDAGGQNSRISVTRFILQKFLDLGTKFIRRPWSVEDIDIMFGHVYGVFSLIVVYSVIGQANHLEVDSTRWLNQAPVFFTLLSMSSSTIWFCAKWFCVCDKRDKPADVDTSGTAQY